MDAIRYMSFNTLNYSFTRMRRATRVRSVYKLLSRKIVRDDEKLQSGLWRRQTLVFSRTMPPVQFKSATKLLNHTYAIDQQSTFVMT